VSMTKLREGSLVQGRTFEPHTSKMLDAITLT
jgi:hypothetical protein